MRLAILALVCGSAAWGQGVCQGSKAKELTYPTVARMVWLQGPIEAHFSVDKNGRATDVRYSGEKSALFSWMLEEYFLASKFPVHCKDAVLRFEFVLREKKSKKPQTQVEFLKPNTYRITANKPVPIIH